MIGPNTAPIVPEALGPKKIDFTSGYRDSTKGATLKALQQRRADIQGQVESAMKTRDIDSMWQGGAQLAEVIGGSIREGRAANQEAAGRARFAELLAGGLAPDEIGEAMGLDPETTMKYQDQTWKREDDLTKHGWDVDAATQRQKDAMEQQKDSQAFTAGQTEDTQRHAIELQEKSDAAQLVLEDHRATIEQKQAAQRVIDEAAAAKKLADARIEEAKTSAKTASDLATQNAAQGDEMAQIALAEKAGYITPEVAQQRRDALNRKALLDSQGEGSKARDRDFGKEAADLEGGGMTSLANNIIQLDKGISILEEPGMLADIPVVGGALQSASDAIGLGKSGALTNMLPDSVQPLINEKGIAARDAIHSAVQESLKRVLGGQFAAIEGTNLLERSFNPALGPKENIDRAKKIKAQIMVLYEQKKKMLEYYKANGGTLEGFGDGSGTLDLTNLLSTLNEYAGSADAAGGDTAAPAELSDEDLLKKYGGGNDGRSRCDPP